MTPTALETERLVLRPLRLSDAEEMTTVLADVSLYDFTGGEPPTVKELTDRYRQQITGPDSADEYWLNWVIRTSSQDRAVGFVQATVTDCSADLAWVLGATEQGRGFASEAGVAVRDWLADNGVRRIEAHVHPRHVASQAVARRVGLVRTGESDDEGEEVWTLALDTWEG